MTPTPTRIRGSRQLAAAILLFSFAAASSLHAQVTNASLSGTYTFQIGGPASYTVQSNMFNQQVGFCPSTINKPPFKLPFGYYCYFVTTASDMTTGTLVADGKGNITKGSFTSTRDPQEYQCATNARAVGDCPYTVPFGRVWDKTIAYVVGEVVDYTVNSHVLTYQAVENNTNIAPNSSTCTATVKPPNCNWDQVYQSADGVSPTKTGTFTGTYTTQSNGSGVVTFSTGASFAFVVQPAPLAVGQVVALQGISAINNENDSTGMAVRVK